jgi:hypothetical protein
MPRSNDIPNTIDEQIARLNARWNKIVAHVGESPKWAPPSDCEWRSLLQKVGFDVLYADCLQRLYSYRWSVKTDASVYLEIIVNNDGPKFLAARGLSRPKFVDEEDEAVPRFVSHKRKSFNSQPNAPRD